VKRQFDFILTTSEPKDENVLKEYLKVATEMENIYSVGTIKYDPNIIKSITVEDGTTRLSLDKHLHDILAKSQDPEELLYVWKGWRDAVGPKLKDKYTEYVRLKNIGARENGFDDQGAYKRSWYETNGKLQEISETFWQELKPFYQEVHAYVRHRLSKVYKGLVKDGEAIPAHLLGNMWSQSWDNIFPLVTPFPDEPALDVTPALEKNYTVQDMFTKSEEFFTSIGWMKLPPSFWTKSLFVQPPDRNVTCHASAWDFKIKVNNSQDVRVKMCTKINQEDFVTIHHELGHIYYYLLYWNQPLEYRTGANPGFHEAVGDTLVLSIQTPGHLNKIGLLNKVSQTKEAELNFLLKTAMERITFLPFGYLMDQWMWGVYSGDIKPNDYNIKWWQMRLKYQGIKPPVSRTENDFDPGAKYHIPADTPYIRYFFAHILQFTFHKEACKAAGNTGPLHKCSIYESKEAGDALKKMLELGKSKPWPEALKTLTGSDKLSAAPIKEYFGPLLEFLQKERASKGYTLGWEGSESSSNAVQMKLSFLTVLFCSVISVYMKCLF